MSGSQGQLRELGWPSEGSGWILLSKVLGLSKPAARESRLIWIILEDLAHLTLLPFLDDRSNWGSLKIARFMVTSALLTDIRAIHMLALANVHVLTGLCLT